MAAPASPDVPDEIFDRVRVHCLSLPEATLRSDRYSHAFEIRRRIFTYLLSSPDGNGAEVCMVVVNAEPDERHALLASGHPYFPPGSGRYRLGIIIDAATDWTEVQELINDSYRLLAPKKLSALLD